MGMAMNSPSRVKHVTHSNGSGGDYADIGTDNLWKYQYGTRNRVAFMRGLEFGLTLPSENSRGYTYR